MLAWLDEHASEVQALGGLVQGFAAVVTVVLTGALVWATRNTSASPLI
jgi:hypothetical protein